MKYKCIIFDCDGTLVDTLEDIAWAMNQSLTVQGFTPVPLEKYRDMVGWGITRLAALALPEDARSEETIQAVAGKAQQLMEEQDLQDSLSKPYPAIREIVAALARQKKIPTIVLSNKADVALHRLLDKLFGPDAFTAICGLRPGINPKPDPSAAWEILAEVGKNPHDTVFLGDSEIDIATARNAGCYPLGASWGFRSRATLEQAGAARIIDHPDELWEFLKLK